MTALSRRGLLGAAVATPAIGLAACASPAIVDPQAVADVDTIARALQAELPAYQAALAAVPAQADLAGTLVQAIAAEASQLSTTVFRTAAQGIVVQIRTDVATLAATLAARAKPGQPQTVLDAAQALLPAVEAAVGAPPAGGPAVSAMTPAQARAALQSAAAA
jgi:hypothetical protein